MQPLYTITKEEPGRAAWRRLPQTEHRTWCFEFNRVDLATVDGKCLVGKLARWLLDSDLDVWLSGEDSIAFWFHSDDDIAIFLLANNTIFTLLRELKFNRQTQPVVFVPGGNNGRPSQYQDVDL